MRQSDKEIDEIFNKWEKTIEEDVVRYTKHSDNMVDEIVIYKKLFSSMTGFRNIRKNIIKMFDWMFNIPKGD